TQPPKKPNSARIESSQRGLGLPPPAAYSWSVRRTEKMLVLSGFSAAVSFGQRFATDLAAHIGPRSLARNARAQELTQTQQGGIALRAFVPDLLHSEPGERDGRWQDA